MQTTKLIYTVTILGMLLVIGGCSTTETGEIGQDRALQAFGPNHCILGSIRPPGASKCLVIDELLAGKFESQAPKGKCPVNWKKQSRNGFCLPEFQVIACGQFTFACANEASDTFRIVRGLSSCMAGTMTVTVAAPRFDERGEVYLGTTPVFACSSPGRIEPDF